MSSFRTLFTHQLQEQTYRLVQPGVPKVDSGLNEPISQFQRSIRQYSEPKVHVSGEMDNPCHGVSQGRG